MGKMRKVNISPKFKDGEGDGIPEDSVWETHLMYSAKGKRFYIAIPEEWKDFVPTDRETAELVSSIAIKTVHRRELAFVGEIEATVIEKAERYFAAFLQEKPQIVKVVIYRIKYSKGESDSDSESERLDKISLDFLICERQAFGSKVIFTEHYKYTSGGREYNARNDWTHFVGGGNSRNRGYYSTGEYRWMEWTPEREAYFTNLRSGMHKLIDMMAQTTGDAETFQTLIDTGGALLLGTGNVEEDHASD